MKPHYTELEDGSILIEWIAPDVRFCINIEVDPSESGWCFVTRDGTQNDCGYLPPEFMRLLTKYAPDVAEATYCPLESKHDTLAYNQHKYCNQCGQRLV